MMMKYTKSLRAALLLVFFGVSAASAQEVRESPLTDWLGEYKGTQERSVQGKPASKGVIYIEVRAIRNAPRVPVVMTVKGENSLDISVFVAADKSKRANVEVSAERLSFKPSVASPYEMILERTTGPFGKEAIKGSFTRYSISADGEAVVMFEGKFTVGKIQ